MKNLVLIPLVIVVVLGLIFSGCAKPAPAPAPAPTPAPAPAPAPTPSGPEEILVGTSMPLTGMYAAVGSGNTFGMRAAVEDINKLGGVYVEEYGRKIPVKLIVLDNESDALKMGSLVEQMILSDKVHFLLSQFLPPPVRVANMAEQHKIPHIIAAGPLEPWLGMQEKPGEYTWFSGFAIAMPPAPGDFRAGKPGYSILDTWKGMLDIYGDQTNKRMGVFASDDPDGVGWYALFPGALEGWGYDVLGEDRTLGLFPLGTMDFAPMIQEWKDYGCEIIWGNAPGPEFGTMLRQCHMQGFEPKMVFAAKAALFYDDVAAWGGDLPNGICTEVKWSPLIEGCPGIGDTTPQSLFERWVEQTGEPLNQGIGEAYPAVQILVDAIERAGTLDGEKVSKAIGETDMMTILRRVKFDPGIHFSRVPIFFGQWQKTDNPWVWECPIVFSAHDFALATAEPIFPITYD